MSRFVREGWTRRADSWSERKGVGEVTRDDVTGSWHAHYVPYKHRTGSYMIQHGPFDSEVEAQLHVDDDHERRRQAEARPMRDGWSILNDQVSERDDGAGRVFQQAEGWLSQEPTGGINWRLCWPDPWESEAAAQAYVDAHLHTEALRKAIAAKSFHATPHLEFAEMVEEVGQLVCKKHEAYGDISRTGDLLKVLYPDGVPAEAYGDFTLVVRVLDKLRRIATDRDAFGESPWQDIAGYALLGLARAKGVVL